MSRHSESNGKWIEASPPCTAQVSMYPIIYHQLDTVGHTNHPFHRPQRTLTDRRRELCSLVSVPLFPVTAISFHHSSVENHHQTTPLHQKSISPILHHLKSIAMASSLRMAAPKMATMAAQSSVKVARSPVQLQKFGRAYSGKPRHW